MSIVCSPWCYTAVTMSGQTSQLTLGEWLEDRLHEGRWTRDRFGREIGYSGSAVKSWIEGNRQPSERACDAIADLLGVPRNFVRELAERPLLPDEPKVPHSEGPNPHLHFFAAYSEDLEEEDWELLEQMARRLLEARGIQP